MGIESTTKRLRLDERDHVVMPLPDQVAGLGREANDPTDMKQTPADTHLESFTDIVMPLVLHERRMVINWLEDNQVEECIKLLAGESRDTPLLESVEPP